MSFNSPPPVAAGVRSIHIALPQAGQPFLFTKILNIGDEPLSIRAHIMTLTAYQAFQMVWQTAAFLFGLLVWWVQWRRINRNTFILTVALALIIGSVSSLLVQWRALHDALIAWFSQSPHWPSLPFLSGNSGRVAIARSRKPNTPRLSHRPLLGGIPPVTAGITVFAVRFKFGLSMRRPPIPPRGDSLSGSIISASYSGTVNNRVAAPVDATLEFSAAAKASSSRSSAVTLSCKNSPSNMARPNSFAMAAILMSCSTVVIVWRSKSKCWLKPKAMSRNGSWHLAFPALSSQVSLVLRPIGSGDVDFPTAATSLKRFILRRATKRAVGRRPLMGVAAG